jgi:hypothetical protein
MKLKHKDAMIAMGIKISALEHLFKMHGQAHMAQDITPQFRDLCKKVTSSQSEIKDTHALCSEYFDRVRKLEGQLNFKLNDGPIFNHGIRIAALEKMPALVDDHIKRLADHDESIQAITETVDQLSACKCQAGEQMLKRIEKLELEIVRADTFRQNHVERIVHLEKYIKDNQPIWEVNRQLPLIIHRLEELEESNAVFLKSIPDIEILKTQMHATLIWRDTLSSRLQSGEVAFKRIEKLEEAVYNSPFSKIVMEEYAENIKTLVRDVDSLQTRVSRAQDMIAEEQRDTRIINSSGYKKEVVAMKLDAKPKKYVRPKTVT